MVRFPEFDSGDLCAIIESCARSGVVELRLPGVTISFQKPLPGQPTGPSVYQQYLQPSVAGPLQNADADTVDPNLQFANPTEIGNRQGAVDSPQTRFDLQTQELLRENEISQLLVTSPSEYEQFVIDQELRKGDFDDAATEYRHPKPNVSRRGEF